MAGADKSSAPIPWGQASSYPAHWGGMPPTSDPIGYAHPSQLYAMGGVSAQVHAAGTMNAAGLFGQTQQPHQHPASAVPMFYANQMQPMYGYLQSAPIPGMVAPPAAPAAAPEGMMQRQWVPAPLQLGSTAPYPVSWPGTQPAVLYPATSSHPLAGETVTAPVHAHSTMPKTEPTDEPLATARQPSEALRVPMHTQASSGTFASDSAAYSSGPGTIVSTGLSALGVVASNTTGAWPQQAAPQAANAVMAQYMLLQQQLQFQQAQANAMYFQQLHDAHAKSAAIAAAAPASAPQVEECSEDSMNALLALAHAAQGMPRSLSPSTASKTSAATSADSGSAARAPRGAGSSGQPLTRGRKGHPESADLDECGPFRCGYSGVRPDMLGCAAAASQLPSAFSSKPVDWSALGHVFCDESVCSFEADSIDELSAHRMAAHRLEIPSKDGLVCMLCFRKVSCRSHLNRHVRSCHTRAFRYDCDTCGRSFSSISNRDAHVRSVHQKRRPHGCPLCYRAFSRRTHLRVHCTKIHRVNIDEMRASEEDSSRSSLALSAFTGGTAATSTMTQAEAVAAAPLPANLAASSSIPHTFDDRHKLDVVLPPSAGIGVLPIATAGSRTGLAPPDMATFVPHRTTSAHQDSTALDAAMLATPPYLGALVDEAVITRQPVGPRGVQQADESTPITSVATLARDAATARAHSRTPLRL